MRSVIEMSKERVDGKTKKLINVKVTIENKEEYEVESCWSQETQEFCEKIVNEVKRFVENMTSRP